MIMKDYSGLQKFQSVKSCKKYWEKSILSKETGDIGEWTKTLSLLNTLMLRYLRKVQRICGEFLADMSNDLPYILRCDWNFSPRVNMAM